MPRYAELIYNGFWFAPEREMLQALIDKSQEHVDGEVRAQALQGQRHRHRPRERQVALLHQRSSPSRTTRAPTTRRTPKASSASTRCGCARWLRAAVEAADLAHPTVPISHAASRRSDPRKQVIHALMLTRFEIGRIAGIPIYLDMMFVLVLLIFTYPYFTAATRR